MANQNTTENERKKQAMENLNEMNQNEIRESSSGAKTSGNLPYYECLTPEFIDRCATRMTEGAIKYGKNNWQQGARDKDYILERLRHGWKHLMNLMLDIELDQVSSDDDAAAVCVNIMMAMRYQYFKLSPKNPEGDAKIQQLFDQTNAAAARALFESNRR